MTESGTTIWDATLYLRLSREDGDKEESNSISAQRDLLRDYLRRNPSLREYAVRIDDGFSGSSFERPAFQKMMADIREGKTNCVIVKDLSRFGRNYLDAGEYIEKVFPFLGVRFIAVNDGYDSEKERTASDFLMLPFRNLINEAYCRDISIKIRSQLEIKRKRGEYIGSFAVYGYLKSETNNHQLVVDEYAAGVVRDIFKWKLEGVSPRLIADRLNNAGVLSPVEHKRSLGMKCSTPFQSNPKALWSASGIISLLKNKAYIGVLTQGVMTTPSYKVHKRIRKEENQWVVIPDHHEAIVSKADFENVQRVLAMDTRACRDDSEVRPLSGVVFCGDCGAGMVRKSVSSGGKQYVYYVCSGNKASRTSCSTHSVRERVLEELVLLSVQHQIQGMLDFRGLIASAGDLSLKHAKARTVQRQIDWKDGELEQCKRLLTSLQGNLTDGMIDYEEYLQLRKRYEEQSRRTENQLLSLRNALIAVQTQGYTGTDWLEELQTRQNITVLDRETVIALIERICIYEDKRIEITFRWHSEYPSQEV